MITEEEHYNNMKRLIQETKREGRLAKITSMMAIIAMTIDWLVITYYVLQKCGVI